MRFYNLARMATRVLAYHTLRQRCPVNVMLAVTNRCNGGCHYCAIPQRADEDMSLATVTELIDQMRAAGTVRLGLWGGEPLLRDDIGEIIGHAKQLGMYVTLDSNGLLWEERSHLLRGLDHLMISIDGDRDAHEANRGQGTFEPTLNALEKAAADPDLDVWSLTVLTRNNLDSIDFLLEQAARLKIYAAFQVLHHNDVLGRDAEEMLPSNDEYRDALRHLAQRKKEGARVAGSSRYLEYLLAWEDFSKPTCAAPHLGLRCKAGKMYCNIDANGDVYPCSLHVGAQPAPNAVEMGFRAAFDALPRETCQGCTATCFTEYNYLYGLDPRCIWEWVRMTG